MDKKKSPCEWQLKKTLSFKSHFSKKKKRDKDIIIIIIILII